MQNFAEASMTGGETWFFTECSSSVIEVLPDLWFWLCSCERYFFFLDYFTGPDDIIQLEGLGFCQCSPSTTRRCNFACLVGSACSQSPRL
jgi:hypothetical protein